MSNLKALTALMTVYIKGHYQNEQKHFIKTDIGIIMHIIDIIDKDDKKQTKTT